jgi:hypothetical protein
MLWNAQRIFYFFNTTLATNFQYPLHGELVYHGYNMLGITLPRKNIPIK